LPAAVVLGEGNHAYAGALLVVRSDHMDRVLPPQPFGEAAVAAICSKAVDGTLQLRAHNIDINLKGARRYPLVHAPDGSDEIDGLLGKKAEHHLRDAAFLLHQSPLERTSICVSTSRSDSIGGLGKRSEMKRARDAGLFTSRKVRRSWRRSSAASGEAPA